MKKLLAILLLLAGSAFAQTHTGAMWDLPNSFTNTDSFSLGITVGPIVFLQLASISNSTTIIYISDATQTNPCAGGGTGAFAVLINGTWDCSVGVVPLRGISFTIGDPAGSALTAASTTTDYVTAPFPCTLQAYNLLINTGTITVKFWKVATGTAIPTSANAINTSGVGVASGTAVHSANLSDFISLTIQQNDILAMNVTAVASATYVNGVLQCQ